MRRTREGRRNRAKRAACEAGGWRGERGQPLPGGDRALQRAATRVTSPRPSPPNPRVKCFALSGAGEVGGRRPGPAHQHEESSRGGHPEERPIVQRTQIRQPPFGWTEGRLTTLWALSLRDHVPWHPAQDMASQWGRGRPRGPLSHMCDPNCPCPLLPSWSSARLQKEGQDTRPD